MFRTQVIIRIQRTTHRAATISIEVRGPSGSASIEGRGPYGTLRLEVRRRRPAAPGLASGAGTRAVGWALRGSLNSPFMPITILFD